MQLGDSDTSLQIVGVYGLILCLAMLLCGAAIGRLVDSTARNRLKHPLESILCFILCSSTRGPQFVLFMQITTFSTYKTKPNLQVKAKKTVYLTSKLLLY